MSLGYTNSCSDISCAKVSSHLFQNTIIQGNKASRSCKLLQMLENLTKLSTFDRGGLQENSCTDNEKRHGNSVPYP